MTPADTGPDHAAEARYYAAVLYAITASHPDMAVAARADLADAVVAELAARGLLAASDSPPGSRPDAATGDAEQAAMQQAIADAWQEAMTPPELREACVAFSAEQAANVDYFRAMMLVAIGHWIVEGERHGHERRVLEQVAAAEAFRAVATLIRGAKERDGAPFVPARLAIVAYFMADNVARAEPFKCDIDGAVAAFLADDEAAPLGRTACLDAYTR